MKIKEAAKYLLLLALIALFSVFFFHEFQKNWVSIQSFDLRPNLICILLSFVAILVTCLLTTYSWFATVNSLSITNKISFSESVAMVNTSNLTKYIPGKVWSYAIQVYWLGKSGFSKSLIMYIYLINTFISLIAFMLLGTGYLVFSSARLPFSLTVSALVFLAIIDILFITLNSVVFNGLIQILNNAFKRDIEYFETSTKLILKLHLIYLVAAFSFGLSAYSMCFGIGLDIAKDGVLLVMASMMISDVIGFLAIIVPGGLGVREGVMFFLLKGVSSKALALILPIATRIVNMLVDISLGVIGFMLLKKITAVRK